MSSLESFILSYLLNSLWQVPLLLAAGYVVARAVKPIGAKAEHRVWVSVLALQSLLPALSALSFEWMRSLWAWSRGAASANNAHVSVETGAGIALNAVHLPPRLVAGIAIAYGGISFYFVMRFLWRWRRLAVLQRESVEVELTGHAAVAWAHCRERFGVDKVTIMASSRILSPVTIGLSRKLLLLPAGMATSLPEDDLRTVFAHEFAHMHRNDFLKNLIYEALSLPASYHPAFRLTRERIMEGREIICDQMAAQISGRNEYARSLLRLASLLVKGTSIRTPHAIGIFDANAFERRLMKLTEKRKEMPGLQRFALVIACAAFGAVTCASALVLHSHVDAMTVSSDNHSTQTSGTLTVPADVMAGNILSKVPPKYPEEAKKERIQGKVLLEAIISKDGSVENLTVVSGPKELQQSSLDAVRQWTYKPYLLNGNRVEIKTTISVIYSLSQ
jgi:TonB family protein